MAPTVATEDYYSILEVEQDASLDEIKQSYRRLAVRLHPDKNQAHDATAIFQRLALAYETLKDVTSRYDYNLIYPNLRRTPASRPPPPAQDQDPRPARPSASTPQVHVEEKQIAAIQKKIRERFQRWQAKKAAFVILVVAYEKDVEELKQKIANLRMVIAHLESMQESASEIERLEEIADAQRAAEAQKSGGTARPVSRIFNEEAKLRLDRGKQETTMDRDMKERRLEAKRAVFDKEEQCLAQAKQLVDDADESDAAKIRDLQVSLEVKVREDLQRRRRAKADQAAEDKRKKDEKEAEEAAEQEKRRQEKEAEEDARWKKEVAEAEARCREKEKKEAEQAANLKERRLQDEAARDLQKARQEADLRKRQQEEIDRATRVAEQRKQAHKREHNKDLKKLRKGKAVCKWKGWWEPVEEWDYCPHCKLFCGSLLHCPHCHKVACSTCKPIVFP